MTNQDLNKLQNTLDKVIDKSLISLTLSKPADKSAEISKINVKPLMIRDKLIYQMTTFKNNQAFHDNLEKKECVTKLLSLISSATLLQLDSKNISFSTLILTNKKGTLTIKSKKTSEGSQKNIDSDRFNHDRVKKYILNEGDKIDFLVKLGVMTPDYKIAKSKFDKFKQLNRYLEFVRDVLPSLTGSADDRPIHIVDFGCGKSYLTFALYYYLKIMNDLNVIITGLDLKEQVIKDCNKLAKDLKYDNLNFYCGDIKDYETITGHKDSDIDMVITLHACDTATDYALYKAIKWNAKIIMAVPCCHKEMNRQLKLENVDQTLKQFMKYSLIKERMASLMTDAYRANCLEEQGYEVQVMEFIDMEHTPKNILIRATKNSAKMQSRKNGSSIIENNYSIVPTLNKLIRTP